LKTIRCMGPPLRGTRPPRFSVKTSGNFFQKKSFKEVYLGDSCSGAVIPLAEMESRSTGVDYAPCAWITLAELVSRSAGVDHVLCAWRAACSQVPAAILLREKRLIGHPRCALSCNKHYTRVCYYRGRIFILQGKLREARQVARASSKAPPTRSPNQKLRFASPRLVTCPQNPTSPRFERSQLMS
jgi:hypothetical protein